MSDTGYNPENYFFNLDGRLIELEIKIEIPHTDTVLSTLRSI